MDYVFLLCKGAGILGKYNGIPPTPDVVTSGPYLLRRKPGSGMRGQTPESFVVAGSPADTAKARDSPFSGNQLSNFFASYSDKTTLLTR